MDHITAECALSKIKRHRSFGKKKAQISHGVSPHNTAVLAEYLTTDDETQYNKDMDKRVNYITEMWGYPDRDKFEGVLHLYKNNGDSIYWLCRFTDPLMRTALRYQEGNYSLLKYDCVTMLQSAKSTAEMFLVVDYAEKVQWINLHILQPFLKQGQVMSYFFDLYQGLNDEDPVSVYFQIASRIILLFIDQKWQEIVDLVDDLA